MPPQPLRRERNPLLARRDKSRDVCAQETDYLVGSIGVVNSQHDQRRRRIDQSGSGPPGPAPLG